MCDRGVHGWGRVWWGGGMHGRVLCMAGGVHGRGCMAGGHAWQGACVAGKTAIAAGGTHPTEMHSCLVKIF